MTLCSSGQYFGVSKLIQNLQKTIYKVSLKFSFVKGKLSFYNGIRNKFKFKTLFLPNLRLSYLLSLYLFFYVWLLQLLDSCWMATIYKVINHNLITKGIYFNVMWILYSSNNSGDLMYIKVCRHSWVSKMQS